jgi:hypothetical protein
MSLWGPSKAQLELDEVVRSSAKIATQFDAVPLRVGEVPSVTGTRFGGVPYAEVGDVWPVLGDRPYDFVGQFDLSECFERPSSAFDLITVFVCWHAVEIDDVENFCIVRSYRSPSPGKANVMERPQANADEDFQVVPCAVEARRVLTYPSPVGSFRTVDAIANLAVQHKDLGKAYVKSLKRIGYKWHDEHTQVGGYPTWVHHNTFDDDDLVFIAQIAHEPAANFCIGDAAPLFIAAHRSNPTRFEADPTQTH